MDYDELLEIEEVKDSLLNGMGLQHQLLIIGELPKIALELESSLVYFCLIPIEEVLFGQLWQCILVIIFFSYYRLQVFVEYFKILSIYVDIPCIFSSASILPSHQTKICPCRTSNGLQSRVVCRCERKPGMRFCPYGWSCRIRSRECCP